jgi:hypothetical protein
MCSSTHSYRVNSTRWRPAWRRLSPRPRRAVLDDGPPPELARHSKQGLLALLGTPAPGKTNLMALRAARELVTPSTIHVSAAGRDLDPRRLSASPRAQTLLDEG